MSMTAMEKKVLDLIPADGLTRWEFVTLALHCLDQAGTYRLDQIRRVLEKEGFSVPSGRTVAAAYLTACDHDETCLTPCAMACPWCGAEREIDEDEALTEDLYFAEPCPTCEKLACVNCGKAPGDADDLGLCSACLNEATTGQRAGV